MKKLGFIGVGNMGGAILKGIEGKLGNTAVFAYDANAEKLADLRLVGATAAGSAREIAEKCDFILLAVKPQQPDGSWQGVFYRINNGTVLIFGQKGE